MARFLIALIFLALAPLAASSQDAAPVPAEEPTAGGPEADSADTAAADDSAPASTSGQPQVKTLSGMSILGNEEAPKSLVIVPWKSSEIGDGIGVGDSIDDRARPVDKDVFLRELRYYQLRAGDSGG